MTVQFVYTCRPCMVCGNNTLLWLDPGLYARWQSGEAIQDVWPDWTQGQRELLITGTHSECWDKAFGDDEDDEGGALVEAVRYDSIDNFGNDPYEVEG